MAGALLALVMTIAGCTAGPGAPQEAVEPQDIEVNVEAPGEATAQPSETTQRDRPWWATSAKRATDDARDTDDEPYSARVAPAVHQLGRTSEKLSSVLDDLQAGRTSPGAAATEVEQEAAALERTRAQLGAMAVPEAHVHDHQLLMASYSNALSALRDAERCLEDLALGACQNARHLLDQSKQQIIEFQERVWPPEE